MKKFQEYFKRALEDPNLIESSVQRVYRAINQGAEAVPGYPFKRYPAFRTGRHPIYGIGDALAGLVKGVETAIAVDAKGQIPIIVLTGPTSSGKTEVAKCIEEIVTDDLQANPKYTFKWNVEGNNKLCPYKEDPFNLLTSGGTLSSRFRGDFVDMGGRPQLCPSCLRTYNNLLSENIDSMNIKTVEEFSEWLNDFVEIVRLPPPIAGTDLASELLPGNAETIISNANRGIFDLSVNDIPFNKIPVENYQTLLQITDGRFNLADGTFLTPDMLVLLCANWSQDEIREKGPFNDRAYTVFVRRNLSWKQEKTIIDGHKKRSVSGLEHYNEIAMTVFAQAVVGSRYQEMETKDYPKTLEQYALFEEFAAGINADDFEKLKEKIGVGTNEEPMEGWHEGISFRKAIGMFEGMDPESEKCLTPMDMQFWLSEQERAKNINKELKNHMLNVMT
jgi:predicted Ser/Thr protein kinase